MKNDLETDKRATIFFIGRMLNKKLTKSEEQIATQIFEIMGNNRYKTADLLEHCCIENDITDIELILKKAKEWKSEDINTSNSNTVELLHQKVLDAFGIKGRKLGRTEVEYINKWTQEYKFDDEIIIEACNRTIEHTQNASFKYADTILTKWYNLNFRSLQDIRILDIEHKQAKENDQNRQKDNNYRKTGPQPNFKQRTYDFEALERDLAKNIGEGF